MNSKAFVALFFNACLLACVQGLGTLTTVAYNGALSIPLLAASAGTFGTAIAVLGVIKLAAAALLLSAGEEAAKAQTFRSRRVQRSAVDAAVTSDKDALFGLIRAMDNLECGKSLICELEAFWGMVAAFRWANTVPTPPAAAAAGACEPRGLAI